MNHPGKLPNIKRIYTESQGHEITGYNHFVTIENYDPTEKISSNFFVDYADEYQDTCTQNIPVWEVTFCTPFDFKPAYDSRDLEPLFQHAILSIGYSEETLFKKYPDIGSITFYQNGRATFVQTMTLARMKSNGHFDSNGSYKREWLKEFDNKFKTHYSDSSKNFR